jgi:CheY-like chemotaxis protein
VAVTKILLVDDNEDDALLLAEAFREVGGNAVVFTHVRDGQAALDALRPGSTAQFDLVISDYYLPIKNAPEIVAQLAEWGVLAEIPVILLSSHLDPQECRRLIEKGVVLVAAKPNEWDDLCTLARKVLLLRVTG